jgi:hypothetical protein
MKITVLAHTVLYNGQIPVAYARVYSDRTFDNGDGETVIAGSIDSENYVKQVSAVGVLGVVTISAFSGQNQIDSTTYGVGGTLASYTLALYSAKGQRLAIVYTNLRVPEIPNPTTWDAIEIYSNAHDQPYRNEYYTADQVNALLAAFASSAQGLTYFQTDWNMLAPVTVFAIPSTQRFVWTELIFEALSDVVASTTGRLLTATDATSSQDFSWNDFNYPLDGAGEIARIGVAGLDGKIVSGNLVLDNDVPIAQTIRVYVAGILRDV